MPDWDFEEGGEEGQPTPQELLAQQRKNYVIRGLIAVLIAVIILTRLDLNGILYLQNTEQRISWYKFKPMWQTKEAVAERLGQGGG